MSLSKLTLRSNFLIDLLFIGMVSIAPASAYVLTPTGMDAEVVYVEPSTDSTGAPLRDLQKVTILYSIGQGTVTLKDVPASSLTGGQQRTTTATFPILPGQERTLRVWATATSTHSKVSGISNVDTEFVDRLAPGFGTTSGAITGTEIEVSYREPSLKANSAPLNDLLKTVIYYDKGQGEVAIREVLATRPQGGGNILQRILVPFTESEDVDLKVYWKAFDVTGNASQPAVPSIKQIDYQDPGSTQ